MNRTKRRSPLVLIAAVLALAFGLFAATTSTAGAAEACVIDPDEYSPSMVLTADPSEVAPGDSVTIGGSNFPANCDVTLEVDGAVLATVTTDGSGAFAFTWAVPGDQPVGDVTIAATAAGQLLATTTLSVTDGSPVTTAPATTTPGGDPTDPGGTATDPGGTHAGGGDGTGSGGMLPATGAQIGALVVGGLLMLAGGAALLLWNRGRQINQV